MLAKKLLYDDVGYNAITISKINMLISNNIEHNISATALFLHPFNIVITGN